MKRRAESTGHQHVRIVIADATPPGAEVVAARRLEDSDWCLLRSPLYAMEVAAGDVIRVVDSETGTFEIVRRGGNVCVQFYLGESDVDDAQATAHAASAIAAHLEPLGGFIDGQTAGLIAFTVPAEVGLPAIEQVFDSAAERWPGAQWQYANVYDPVTGDPLGWWERKESP
jgi:hypothetical protein